MLEHGTVTIKKIAELAGVSRGTVDRVLNERPGVDPSVRERIRKLEAELNYRPNQAAKALSFNKKPFTVGIVLPPRELEFFETVRSGIQAAVKQFQDFGLRVEERFASNVDAAEVVAAVDSLVGEGVQGLMVTGMDHPSVALAVNRAVDRGIPVVTFNSDIGGCRRSCFVGQDLRQGGRIAGGLMGKMLAPTARVLVVAGNRLFQAQRERVEGFCEGWAGPREDVVVVETFDQGLVTEEKVRQVFSEHPGIEGLYLASSPVEACLRVLGERGGPRARVVCNDLLPDTRKGLTDGLVDFTILQDEFQQGYRPVRLLFEKITADLPWPGEHNYVVSTIVCKENLGVPPSPKT